MKLKILGWNDCSGLCMWALLLITSVFVREKQREVSYRQRRRPRARRGREGCVHKSRRASSHMDTFDFGLTETNFRLLVSCPVKKYISVVSRCQVCGNSVWQPQETNQIVNFL